MTELLEDIETLVTIESPSSDPDATAHCLRVFGRLLEERTGVAAEPVVVDGHTHLRWSVGTPRVLLLGHLDTVWPHGTLARLPFRVAAGRATGPGIFDMKAGAAMGLHALTRLDDLDGMALLLTSDEEVGATTSRALVEATARGVGAVLVLEPAAGRAVKVARKGIGTYRLQVVGRAAHAGLEPERGANALLELAHQVQVAAGLSDPEAGTTVTPTVAAAGTTINTVPASAEALVDTRAWTEDEQQRVHEELHSLVPWIDGCHVSAHGEINRPPLTRDVTMSLFARASAVAERLGIAPLEGAEVGGGSDGNFTGALGIPTLDGLGAIGDGAHAEHEHVEVEPLAERVHLLAALCTDLLTG